MAHPIGVQLCMPHNAARHISIARHMSSGARPTRRRAGRIHESNVSNYVAADTPPAPVPIDRRRASTFTQMHTLDKRADSGGEPSLRSQVAGAAAGFSRLPRCPQRHMACQSRGMAESAEHDPRRFFRRSRGAGLRPPPSPEPGCDYSRWRCSIFDTGKSSLRGKLGQL